MSKVVSIATATLIVAAATVGLTAPAEAAAKPRCTTGTWKLVGEKGWYKGVDGKGRKFKTVVKGAAGVRLKLGGGKAAYSFTGSKKERFTYTDAKGHISGWARYTGSLTVGFKVTGNKSGTVLVKHRTAKGNAVVHPSKGSSVRLAPVLRKNSESLVAMGNWAGFGCSSHFLVLVSSASSKKTSYDVTLTYRRV
ncbi:MAG: hypothetical protein ABIS86_23395 [Streptosporangiaceae bacterium]